jgi:hypothetical protein
LLYLLDANVLIDAHNKYYPLEVVPEFWGWLIHMGESGIVKIPLEIYEEVKDGNDALVGWVKEAEVEAALLLTEEVDAQLVGRVVDDGYASDLTDVETIKIGRDPFLIAYAAIDAKNRIVVSTEVERPKKTRANRKVPDVAAAFNVDTIMTFELVKRLGFTTSWSP